MQYLRARYYNPGTAAFMTEDSYLGDFTDPLTLNRYNYVRSSPLNYIDPSGHITETQVKDALKKSSLSILGCMNYKDTIIKVHLTIEDLIEYGFAFEGLDPSMSSYYEAFWTFLINQYTLPEDAGKREKFIRQFMTQASLATNGGDIMGFGSKFSRQKQHVTAEALIRMGWTNVNPFTMYLLNSTLEKYDMTSTEQKRHFIAQVTVESKWGSSLTESYNGNSPETYFAERDKKGFNKVVLVDGTVLAAEKGDGAKYRGAGYIQITWKSNYYEFAKSVDDLNIVNEGVTYLTDKYAWEAAAWYWKSTGIKAAIDKGNATFTSVSKGVNTGSMISSTTPNGLEEREEAYELAKKYIK